MGWRVAVVGANHDLQLAHHTASFFLVLAQHAQGPDAFAVQAETLAERSRDKEGEASVNKLLHRCAVFCQAISKALVGHVQKGYQLVGLDDADHLIPLRWRDVVAGRVVAAGVQYDDGTRRSCAQIGQHAGKVQVASLGVVVAVGLDFETGIGEQGAVVLPARVADQHLGIGVQVFQKIGANLQAAGAAQGLDGGNAATLDGFALGTEHQRLDGSVVGHNAVNRQIAARRGLVHHGLFGRLHASQQRQLAVVVVIDADTQVDLGWVCVGSILLVQAQNRVTRGHFDSGEERHEKILRG